MISTTRINKFIILLCFLLLLLISPAELSINNNHDYTKQEKMAITKIREIMGDDLYKDYMKTNEYLIRWLRDSNMDLEKTKKRLNENIKYRKENKIDQILDEDFSDMFHELPFVIVDGLDMDGDPIATFALGKCNLRKVILQGHADRFYRFIDYAFEKCFHEIMARNVSTGTAIIDLNGYTLRTHGCVACVPAYVAFVKTGEQHYPQILKHFDIINAPRIFQPMYQLLQPLITPYTRKTIRLFAYDKTEWIPKVLERIPKEILTPEYGGTKHEE